jgi:ferredoxin
MDDDPIYRDLQRHLDRGPVPFPATSSGVEIRVLKHFFTPEEARLALALSALPEPLAAIHRRVAKALTMEQLGACLDRLAAKGSIQRVEGKTGPSYSKLPLVLGMYEMQVNRLTAELERDVRAYLDEAFAERALFATRTPQMRTVPVNKSIPVDHAVASYDDIRRFVQQSPGPFAALNCVCRQGKDLTGEPCLQTSSRQRCLMIGSMAALTVERGAARPLTRDEMLSQLEDADRDGLVLQPQNARNPLFICCCCSCCCGVLTTARKLRRPADYFQTDFKVELDAALCESCGTCETRCPMGALYQVGGLAALAEERCIGCGLCVTTCPSGALHLRPKDGRKPPPSDMQALYATMFRQRYGALRAAAAVIGRAFGRKF